MRPASPVGGPARRTYVEKKNTARPQVRSGPARGVLWIGTLITLGLATAAAIVVPGGLTASNVVGRAVAFTAVLFAVYRGVLIAVWTVENRTAKQLGEMHAPDDEKAVSEGLEAAAAQSEGSKRTAELLDAMKAQLATSNEQLALSKEQVKRLSMENQRVTDELAALRAENARLREERGADPTKEIRVSRAERTPTESDG
jgi:hypothetical protein